MIHPERVSDEPFDENVSDVDVGEETVSDLQRERSEWKSRDSADASVGDVRTRRYRRRMQRVRGGRRNGWR